MGNLRTVRGYRPDGSGRDKGTLQKRSFERVRHKTPYPLTGEKLHRGLQPRNDSRPRFPYRVVRGGESPQGIIGKDYTRAKRENDGIRVGCFGRQAQQPLESVMIYQHTSIPTCKPITMVIYIAGSIPLFRGKRSNHFRLQRQSKHGALCRLKGQAAAPFPDKSSSRFAASVFIGKTLYPTAPPPTTDRKGKIIRWGYTGKQTAGTATAERQTDGTPQGIYEENTIAY